MMRGIERGIGRGQENQKGKERENGRGSQEHQKLESRKSQERERGRSQEGREKEGRERERGGELWCSHLKNITECVSKMLHELLLFHLVETFFGKFQLSS